MKKILYISYDGMTDQLGQSQVIPYLTGLSRKGHSITLISCEKEKEYKVRSEIIKEILRENNITWIALSYTKFPPVFSTLWDIIKIYRTAKSIVKKAGTDIVHCRSYIAAAVGLRIKKKFKVRFIFDMRGFWVDERVEGKIWNLKNPVYNLIYYYFKKLEKKFLTNADYIISLTENAKNIIDSWELRDEKLLPIQVIPCCCDTALFSPENIDEEKKAARRKELNMNGKYILSYLGALGTWYMLDEMLHFFKVLTASQSDSRFLFITAHDKTDIIRHAKKYNIQQHQLIILQCERKEVPMLLILSDASVFFIRQSFSKRASSPTKQGEIMSMGVPIICNTGIGDTSKIISDAQAGIVIPAFNETEYTLAVKKLLQIHSDKKAIRNAAIEYFSIEWGVELYDNVYNAL